MPALTRRSTSPGRIQFPTTPPPLRRADVQEFGERRRSASRGLQEAMARRGRGRATLDLDFADFQRRLGRDVQRNVSGARGDNAARGLAFSPAGLGRELRTIRDTAADAVADEGRQHATQLAALEEAVRDARINRDLEINRIGADRSRRITELDRLIQAVGL